MTVARALPFEDAVAAEVVVEFVVRRPIKALNPYGLLLDQVEALSRKSIEVAVQSATLTKAWPVAEDRRKTIRSR